MPLSQSDIDTSLQLVITTFKEFRPELLRHYGSIKHESKENESPVTELDIKIETTVKERLSQQFPHIGFHGEETEDTESTCGATWVVDPIDGTSSFIHGLSYCTNMAGLVVNGEIVAAVIYQFVTDDLYTAKQNEGAHRNGERIHIKNTPLNDSLVFASSVPYKRLYSVLQPHKIGLYAPLGASGYEFTRLAQGSIQGVTKLNCGSQVHDNVPGVLIAREAGAVLETFDDKDYTPSCLQFVIGTPNFIDVIKSNKVEIKKLLQ
jgi:fructose-1,6-bisphosphatase/inositol monophosphatase family enzyme